MKKFIDNEKRGITLIALVVTIAVLIILAGISITFLNGDNGIINKAGASKEDTLIAEEKEQISNAYVSAFSKNRGAITEEDVQQELDSLAGNGKTRVTDEGNSFIVKYLETERYYEIGDDGKPKPLEVHSGEKVLTIQYVNSVGTILEEKRFQVVKDSYSKKVPETIEYTVTNADQTTTTYRYEASVNELSGTITESKTVQALFYLICDSDATMLFTGLDASGNVTTDEANINSYMIGINNSTYGNGMKAELRSIKSVLYVPETYKDKPVTMIGKYALGKINFVKTVLSDVIQSTEDSCLKGGSLGVLTLGRNLTAIKVNSFSSTSYSKVIFRCNTFTSGMACYFPKYAPLELDGNEDKFYLEDDVLYSPDKTIIYRFAPSKTGTFEIPASVTRLFNYSFYGSNLSYIVIPETVTQVNDSAFRHTYMTEITIGKNVTSAGTNAFTTDGATYIIDSPTIAAALIYDTRGGGIGGSASVVYFKDNITNIGSYILNNFTLTQSDKSGYTKYVKN